MQIMGLFSKITFLNVINVGIGRCSTSSGATKNALPLWNSVNTAVRLDHTTKWNPDESCGPRSCLGPVTTGLVLGWTHSHADTFYGCDVIIPCMCVCCACAHICRVKYSGERTSLLTFLHTGIRIHSITI